MNNRDQRLPKKEIIHRRRDFRDLFQRGRCWEGKFLRIYHLPAEGRHVGFSVPKRFGNAVHRNRVKRLMRENYRKHRWQIHDCSIVMFAKSRAKQAGYLDIQNEIKGFLSEWGTVSKP